jgi:hypothetical protein
MNSICFSSKTENNFVELLFDRVTVLKGIRVLLSAITPYYHEYNAKGQLFQKLQCVPSGNSHIRLAWPAFGKNKIQSFLHF